MTENTKTSLLVVGVRESARIPVVYQSNIITQPEEIYSSQGRDTEVKKPIYINMQASGTGGAGEQHQIVMIQNNGSDKEITMSFPNFENNLSPAKSFKDTSHNDLTEEPGHSTIIQSCQDITSSPESIQKILKGKQ